MFCARNFTAVGSHGLSRMTGTTLGKQRRQRILAREILKKPQATLESKGARVNMCFKQPTHCAPDVCSLEPTLCLAFPLGLCFNGSSELSPLDFSSLPRSLCSSKCGCLNREVIDWATVVLSIKKKLSPLLCRASGWSPWDQAQPGQKIVQGQMPVTLQGMLRGPRHSFGNSDPGFLFFSFSFSSTPSPLPLPLPLHLFYIFKHSTKLSFKKYP